jgi:hypothetical protein
MTYYWMKVIFYIFLKIFEMNTGMGKELEKKLRG